jgi:hypothetical protein
MVKDNNFNGLSRFGGAADVVLSDFFFQHLVHVTENVAEPLGERKKKKERTCIDHTDFERGRELWRPRDWLTSRGT